MKKIFSLLVMLVMTATAFAQSTSEKIIPDGTQPNGGTITPKAITVDWATQKIVANVDLTNCLTGTNEQIFAISTNSGGYCKLGAGKRKHSPLLLQTEFHRLGFYNCRCSQVRCSVSL